MPICKTQIRDRRNTGKEAAGQPGVMSVVGSSKDAASVPTTTVPFDDFGKRSLRRKKFVFWRSGRLHIKGFSSGSAKCRSLVHPRMPRRVRKRLTDLLDTSVAGGHPWMDDAVRQGDEILAGSAAGTHSEFPKRIWDTESILKIVWEFSPDTEAGAKIKKPGKGLRGKPRKTGYGGKRRP